MGCSAFRVFLGDREAGQPDIGAQAPVSVERSYPRREIGRKGPFIYVPEKFLDGNVEDYPFRGYEFLSVDV